MSSRQIKVEDVPYPEGRFSLSDNEFITLLIEAIEQYILTSNHPPGKKLMLKPVLLAKYIAYGTLNSFYRCYYNDGFRKISRKTHLILRKVALVIHGKYYVLPANAIELLKKMKEGVH